MPTPPVPTNEEFADRRRRLLPPGQAWVWSKVGERLLVGFGSEQVRFREAINQLLVDFLPQTAVNLLKEWLDSVSLPDNCTDKSLNNQDVLEILRQRGAESVEDYEALFPGTTVVEKFISYVDLEVDFELVEYPDWQHTWILEVPEAIAGLLFAIVDEFEVDEPIETFTNNFQCKALKEFPAHQQVFIVVV